MAWAKPPKQKENTQGLAFIICNSYDNEGNTDKEDLERLPGTEADMRNWIDALTELNFDCRFVNNASRDAMLRFMKSSSDITPNQKSSNYVIFVFSGHGDAEAIYSDDNGRISNGRITLKKILKPLFKGTMIDKTKLIYIDACRRVFGDPKSEYVPESIVPQGANSCFLFYPTHLGGGTPGESVAGSTFSREASKLLLAPLTVDEMGSELMKKVNDCKECKSTNGLCRFISLRSSDEKESTEWKDLQRPGDSVNRHSLPSTGQPNQGGSNVQTTTIIGSTFTNCNVNILGSHHGPPQSRSTPPRVPCSPPSTSSTRAEKERKPEEGLASLPPPSYHTPQPSLPTPQSTAVAMEVPQDIQALPLVPPPCPPSLDQNLDDALAALLPDLRTGLSLEDLLPRLERPAGGFMSRTEKIEVEEQTSSLRKVDKIVSILRTKSNEDFRRFLAILDKSGNELWAKNLRARISLDLQRPGDFVNRHSLPSTGQPNQGDQQTMPPSTTPIEDQRTLALSKAHEKLKWHYTKRPAECKQFVNLAIVKRPSKVDKTKKDVKEFVEATAHGIDRYTEEQKKIEYRTILSSTGSDSGKRVLVSGSPGSGKTTLAHQLCRDLYSGHLPNQYQLVLFTELKAFRSYTNKPKNKEASLLTLLEYSGLHETDSLCSMIEKEEGRGVAIILDGYDEISDVASCETMAEWVSELFRDAPHLKVSKCDVFVTTRPSQLSQLITRDDSVHLEILGFSSRDIERYIKAYDFKSAPNKAEEVIRRLTNLPLVRGLCSNPRVLDIACKVLKHQDEEPLPANLSGIFLRYVCYQLEVDLKQRREVDLKQRQPPVETRIKDLLSVPKELFPGFYTLCSLAYRCCLNQQLILEKQELVEVNNYINCRESVYNLLFGEEVDSPSEMSCMLYQCDHKTVMEALAAVHIAVLSPAEQQKIWEEWFTAPHMAQVWMMYCGLTSLQSVDLMRLCSLTMSERSREVAKDLKAGALKSEDKLVMVSLFEAGKVEEAECILPVLLKNTIQGYVTSQHDVLCLAYSITHHPDLSRVRLDLPEDCSELDLQQLTTSLRKVKAVQLVSQCSNMLTVLPRAVEDLTLQFLGSSPTRMEKSHNIAGPAQQKGTSKGLGDALRDCHCLRSLTVNRPPDWTELDGVLTNPSLTELHLKDARDAVPTPSIKNLLVHHEKCSLKMKLTYDQLSTVLFGLKKADKLKELVLIGTNISSPKAALTGHLTAKQTKQFRMVEALVAAHPHLAKVDVNNNCFGCKICTVPLLIAVAKGAIRNKNITHLGLGHPEIRAVRGLLGLSLADHITTITAEYTYVMDDAFYYESQADAWSKDVIAGPMARHTCSLLLRGFPSAFLGLLLSRVNKATKLKDLSLVVFGLLKGDFNLVDVRAVETAFSKCNLHKLRIKFEGVSDQSHSHCHLKTAILNGLAANTTTQVDSCIYSDHTITRHLSQQILQKFEVVRTENWSFIISRDPPFPPAPVPAPDPLLSTPSQPTILKPVTTPPETPKPVTTPPDPFPTPPDVGVPLENYKDRILSEVMSRK